MKDIIIRNENASHRFIRNYMAAQSIADLNTLKHEGVDINHGSRRVRCNLNTIPANLLGDKPSQPTSDRLTYQPFATLSV
jgi:hypothetical protein